MGAPRPRLGCHEFSGPPDQNLAQATRAGENQASSLDLDYSSTPGQCVVSRCVLSPSVKAAALPHKTGIAVDFCTSHSLFVRQASAFWLSWERRSAKKGTKQREPVAIWPG